MDVEWESTVAYTMYTAEARYTAISILWRLLQVTFPPLNVSVSLS